MSNYISKQTSYDIAYEVAQKAKKVLGLSEYDRETLEHDINNLRAHEWIDLFNMIPDSNEVKKLYFTHCVELEDENEQELDESMNTFTTVRTRLNRLCSPYQAQLWDNGRFEVHQVKEDDKDRLVNSLRRISKEVHATANGKYDFSRPAMFGGMHSQYYNIYGEIEMEDKKESLQLTEDRMLKRDFKAEFWKNDLVVNRPVTLDSVDDEVFNQEEMEKAGLLKANGDAELPKGTRLHYLGYYGYNYESIHYSLPDYSNVEIAIYPWVWEEWFNEYVSVPLSDEEKEQRKLTKKLNTKVQSDNSQIRASKETSIDCLVEPDITKSQESPTKSIVKRYMIGIYDFLDRTNTYGPYKTLSEAKNHLENIIKSIDVDKYGYLVISLYTIDYSSRSYKRLRTPLDTLLYKRLDKLVDNDNNIIYDIASITDSSRAFDESLEATYLKEQKMRCCDDQELKEGMESNKKLMLVWNHFDPSNMNLIYDNDFSRLESYMSTEDEIICEDEGVVEPGIFLLAHNDESEMLSFVGYSIEDVKTKFIQAVEQAKVEAQEYEDEDLNLGDPFYYCTDNLNLSSEEMFNEWINWITSSQVDGDSGYAWHLIDVANKQVLYGSEESEVIFYDSVNEYFNDLTGGLDNIEEGLNENTITSTLPPVIDKFLMDCAQMYCNFDYTDISNFGERATEDDIKLLRKIRTDLKDGFDEDDPEVSDIFNEIEKIVKGTGLTEATGQRGRYEVEVFDEGDWHKLNSWSTIDKAIEAGEAAVEAVYQDYRVIDKESGEPIELTEDYEGIDITESVLAGAILTGLGTSIGAGLISAVQKLFKKDPSKKKSKWIDYKGYLIEKTPEGEIKLFDAQSKQIGKGIEFHTMKQAQKYIKDLKKGKITDEEPFPEFEAQQDSSSEVNESVLMEKDPNLTDSQKKYVEDMYNKDMEFYGFASYDSEDDFVEDVTIDFDELEAIEMYKYYKQLHEVNGTEESLNGDVAEETELDESYNPTGIANIAKNLKVNGPRSREDRKPEAMPGYINEINIPDNMRLKSYDFREQDNTLYIEWVTQESFNSEDVNKFIDEVAAAIDFIADSLDFIEGFETVIEVTSRDGKEYGYAKERLRFEPKEADSEQIEEAKSNNSLSARLKARLNKLTECNSEDQLTEEKLSTRLIRRLNQGKINEASIVEEATDVDLTEESLKWNIGSDKLVSTDSEEFARLVDLAKLLQEKSPNGFMYTVEKTYEDFGAGMQWYNIICHNKKGDRWQVLNTKQWLELANGKLTVEQSYDSIIKDEYFQDKISGDVNTMNHSQLLKFMDSFDEE